MVNKKDNRKNPEKNAKQIEKLIVGNFESISKPTNDSDTMGIAIFNMANYLRELSEVAYAASIGDYTKKTYSHTHQRCNLAASLNTIINKLSDTLKQLNLIARGNYQAKKSNKKKDTLEIALFELGASLKKIKESNQKLLLSNAKLQNLAATDPLTKVHNRLNFSQKIEQLITLAKRKKRLFAILVFDIDSFKSINDKLGHDKGDEVLINFAALLKRITRASDDVVRMGGDEFAVILTDINDNNEVPAIVNNILNKMDEVVLVSGYRKKINFSVGMACYPADGKNHIELLKHADLSLYKDKCEK